MNISNHHRVPITCSPNEFLIARPRLRSRVLDSDVATLIITPGFSGPRSWIAYVASHFKALSSFSTLMEQFSYRFGDVFCFHNGVARFR
jgi:hypothetical protein